MKRIQFISAAISAASSVSALAEPIDFVRDVRPILEEHCYDCHGPDKQKSGLRLDIREAAFNGGEYHKPNIAPGKADESLLLDFIRGDDEEMRMPPKGDLLSAAQIATLTGWIAQGAVWPDGVDLAKLEDKRDHWSFKPVASFQGEHSIDSFITKKLHEQGLKMSPKADRVTWLRRVTFDLIGIPPTPKELDDFLNDPQPGAHARVVDRLLESKYYGERWAQHWLDVVRYADTHGFEVNTPRANAWPYRDYVIDAFNRDLPYDQFVQEQIMGDAIGNEVATGFLVTAAALLPGQIGKDDASKRLARQDELGEIVINVGESILGLSFGCARCHDHKFDPISAQDYYSLQAFFAGVGYGDRNIENAEVDAILDDLNGKRWPIEKELGGLAIPLDSGETRAPLSARANLEKFTPVTSKKLRFTISSTISDNLREPYIDELEVFDLAGNNIARSNVKLSSSNPGKRLSYINDGVYGNERSWASREKGKGWVQLDFDQRQTFNRIHWGRDRIGKYGDRLAVEYRFEVEDESGKWITIADARNRTLIDNKKLKAPLFQATDIRPEHRSRATSLLEDRKKILAELLKYPGGKQQVFAALPRDPETTHLLLRGDAEQPQHEVPPAGPKFLTDMELPITASDAERRKALAEWVTDPENPLTARVMVNRIWQGHFGFGLVETSNDFGRAGTKPSHPELLDWLAAEFIRSGWSVKHMHRLILLSETYRQSAKIDPTAQAKDGDVRLLWRFPSRRLEAELIRDSMLSVSGRLNPKSGGPGFDLFKSRGGLSGFPPVESFKGDGLRRMIFAHKIRMEQESVFGAFDCPDAGQSVSRRRQSTTPIQALNLFNSRFTIEESDAFADRIKNESGGKTDDQVTLVYQLAFNRKPDQSELQDGVYVVKEHGLPTLCRAVFNSSEFLFIP